jgi:hypothetical protein
LIDKQTIRTKIVVNTNVMEQVTNFNYLGCHLISNRNLYIQDKLQRFNCGTIKRTSLHKTHHETTLKFYEVLAVPSFILGSEYWVITKNQLQQFEATEQRFLRPAAGCQRREQRRNGYVIQEPSIFNL